MTFRYPCDDVALFVSFHVQQYHGAIEHSGDSECTAQFCLANDLDDRSVEGPFTQRSR
jgi:hypothetical protein